MTWLAVSLDPNMLIQQGGLAAALVVSLIVNWYQRLDRDRERAENVRLNDKLLAQAERLGPMLVQTSEVIEKNTEVIDRGRRR